MRRASADYHLRHSADSACHQSFEYDTEPLASAGIGNRSAPCFRQYTDGADRADCGGESGNDFIGRYCRFAVERGLCIRGQYLAFAQEFSQTLNPPEVDASILLHASTFGWALLFCFVLNLMSSGFPAWKASRIGIVNALGGRLH